MTIDVAPAAAAAADATEMPLHDTTPDFYYIKTDDVPKTGFYKRFEQIFEHAEETLENPPTIIDFLIIPQFGMKLPGGKTFSSAGEKQGLFLNSITDSIDEMYALYLTADNADKNASDDDYTLRGGVKNLKAVLTFHYDEEYHCIKIDYLCVNHLFQYKGAGTKILEYFIGMIKKYVIYYNEIHNKNFGITIRLFSLKDAVTFYIKNEFDFDDDDDKDYYGPINYDDIRSYYALINNANKDISKINKKKFKHVRKFTKNLKKGPLAVYMHKTVTSHNGRTHEGRIPTQSLEFGGGRKSRRIKPIKPIKKKTSKRGKKL
jgi:GNAT superfamily N-acetyltransferase